MVRLLYSLILASMLPLMVVRLFWRSRSQRGYRENIGERFGRYDAPALQNCIWIHAVSVGETRAAQPVVRRLRETNPGRAILLTCMTPTGRATAHELFGDTVTSVFLPYDLVGLHSRLITRFSPSVLLVMETEIWPNLFLACRRNNIPSLIVNARLSEKSLRGYLRFAPIRTLIRDALQSAKTVAAQSAADAERLRLLGAGQTEVTGNIKFDVRREPALQQLGEQWRATQLLRRVLLCASTREGEEALLLAAYASTFDLDARRNTLLIIVPRHPQRFDQVAAGIAAAGLSCSHRSSLGANALAQSSTEVFLGDSMGEMTAYYAMCDLAIIGGSFLPLGGQNLIEACALGKPVVMGPSTFNFTEVAKLANESGAMLAVADAVQAMQAARALLGDPERCRRMSDAGLALVEQNRGATEKTLALVAAALGSG
ncbi:MAG: 3-deoxy-D-manno-octulosonic acid transferase [Usitatibacteraceae bacterium]